MNPKIIETLIGKIGLTPVQAIWAITMSEKHALWIANQIKAKPEIYPKEAGNLKKILAWKKKNTGIDIGEYDYAKALSAALEDIKTSFKKEKGSFKNENIVAVCGDSEFKWVELKTQEDCVEEGRYMRHCLRNRYSSYLGEGSRLFSLRTEYNKPVLTLQVRGNEIGEYRAKFNNNPEPQYTQYFKFLEEQAKLIVSPFAKYNAGLTKTIPTLEKSVIGDLTMNIPCEIPEGFNITGSLTLTHSEIKFVKGMVIGGDLVISTPLNDNKGRIPSDLKVHGKIVLDAYAKLPNGYCVNGNLVVNDTDVKLPKNLEIKGDLEIQNNMDGGIPDGTKIGGDLLLNRYASIEIDTRKFELKGVIKFNVE